MPPVSATSSAPSALGYFRIGFGDGYVLKRAPTQPRAEDRCNSLSGQSEEIKVWWEQCPRAASNPSILDSGPVFGVISAAAGTSVPLHSKL